MFFSLFTEYSHYVCSPFVIVTVMRSGIYFCLVASESEGRSVMSHSLRPHGLYSP